MTKELCRESVVKWLIIKSSINILVNMASRTGNSGPIVDKGDVVAILILHRVNYVELAKDLIRWFDWFECHWHCLRIVLVIGQLLSGTSHEECLLVWRRHHDVFASPHLNLKCEGSRLYCSHRGNHRCSVYIVVESTCEVIGECWDFDLVVSRAWIGHTPFCRHHRDVEVLGHWSTLCTRASFQLKGGECDVEWCSLCMRVDSSRWWDESCWVVLCLVQAIDNLEGQTHGPSLCTKRSI
jgi:hypothetical protein